MPAGCLYLEPIEGAIDRPLEPPLVVRALGTSVVCFALSDTFLATASPGGRCYLYDLLSPTHSRLQAFRLDQAHGVIRELACHPSQCRHALIEHAVHALSLPCQSAARLRFMQVLLGIGGWKNALVRCMSRY